MNDELIGTISNEGALEGVIEDDNFNVKVQITESGPRGLPGSDGYTPIKGIDYFDGEKGDKGDTGERGLRGNDGYTPIKGVDYFDGIDGKQGIQGVQGDKGTDGVDGYTPKKGVDYWIESDITEIKTYIDESLGVIENGAY